MFRICLHKRMQGVVSIFLLIILLPTMVFSTLLMEMGRYKSAQNLLDEAAENAAVSVLADYNKVLYEEFGLYAFDEQDEKKLKKDFLDYLKANCADLPVGEEYSAAASQLLKLTDKVTVNTFYSLRTNNVLMRQLEEYSKYRAPTELALYTVDFETLKNNALKELGKKILGESLYKNVQASLKQLNACVDFLSSVKDFLYVILDAKGSVEGYDFLESMFAKEKNIRSFFSEGKELPGTGKSYKKMQSELEKAIVERNKIMKEMEEEEREIAEIIQLAKEFKNFADNATNQEITSDAQIASIIPSFSKGKYINLDAQSTIADWYTIAKEEKYGFGKISDNFSESQLQVIVDSEKAVLGKKNSKELDKAIEKVKEAKDGYADSLGNVKKKLAAYQKKLVGLGDTVNAIADDLDSSADLGRGEILAIINRIFNKGFSYYVQQTNLGIDICQNCKKEVENLSEYSISKSNISYPSVTELKKSYLRYDEAMSFVEAVAGMKLLGKISEDSPLGNLVKNLKKVKETLTPVPYLCVREKNTNLSSETIRLNQSRKNDDNEYEIKDSNQREKLLQEAKKFVPAEYYTDIANLSKNNSKNNDALYEEIVRRIDELYEAVYSLMKDNNPLNVLQKFNIISILLKLKSTIKSIKTIFENVLWLAKRVINEQGAVVLEALFDGVGDKFLTAYYINEKAKNRLNDSRTDCFEEAQIFKSCNAEYVLIGKTSELENQIRIFGRIMILRLLSNMITMLTDSKCMSIIGECSILAPVVFLIWDYYEANVDMNVLLRVGESVPLVKEELALSANTMNNLTDTVMESLQKVISADEGTDKENKEKKTEKKTGGLFGDSKKTPFADWEYKDYLLLFMILMPQGRALERMGDIIQMEVRYAEKKKNGETNFRLDKANTYLRTEITGTLNPLLPVKSLSGGKFAMDLFKLNEVNYNGY